ncbi:hypothetical protein KO489_11165 [Reinekea forsetii]|nr:hypothetical protein [Reinekea forsetii]
MSKYADQFESHQIHGSIAQLEEWLSLVDEEIPEDAVEELRVAKKTILQVKQFLADADPELVRTQMLNNLDAILRHAQVWNHISQFHTSKNVSQLAAANNHLGASLAAYPGILWSVDPKYSLTDIETTADSLQILYGNLKKQVVELSKEKDRLETEIDAKNTEVNSQINQWQQQFSEAQENRSEKYNLWREQVKKEIDTDAQEISDKFETDIENSKQKILDELAGLRESSKNKHQDILELYQLASGDSIAGGYAQSANNEEKAANFWRWFSIVFIGITFIWLVIAFSQYDNTVQPITETDGSISSISQQSQTVSFNWQRYLVGASITGVLLFGAGFTARQSSKHREEAIRTRRFALQIKALDPYINSMDENAKNETRKALLDRFFTGVDFKDKDSKKLDEDSMNFFVSTLQSIVKAVK